MCRDATRRGVTLRYVTWHRRRGIVLGPLPLLQPHACVCVSLGAGRLFVGACRQDGRGGERGTLAVALAVSAGRTTPDPAARRGRGHRKTMTIVMVAVMMVMVMGRSRINCLLCCAVPYGCVFFFGGKARGDKRSTSRFLRSRVRRSSLSRILVQRFCPVARTEPHRPGGFPAAPPRSGDLPVSPSDLPFPRAG